MAKKYIENLQSSQETVKSKVGAWKTERNAARATIDWRFTILFARDKPKKPPPVKEDH